MGVPSGLNAEAVRRWSHAALARLGRAREEIDALNVYPVPDGDTGTNMFLTLESGTAEIEALYDQAFYEDRAPSPRQAIRALAHGALMGARGNSGVILSQLFRGIAAEFDEADSVADFQQAGAVLRQALRRAAEAGYVAVAEPVEGTMLTVARAAATSAEQAPDDLASVVRAAARGARAALARTPDQLEALRRAGVVDAGGRGLCVLLDALVTVVTGEHAEPHERTHHVPVATPVIGDDETGPAFEVIYLLDATDQAIAPLKARLSALGDSLVIVGGEGLWSIHVHVDDAGAAVEAGIEAGRPHRVRITHLERTLAHREPNTAGRAVVAVAYGDGMAALFGEAGAHVVEAGVGRSPSTGVLLDAIRQAGAREIVLLPNDPDGHAVADVAAERAGELGFRVQVIPTKAAVQGLAALAVHDAHRRFEQDVIGMTSAAGATRYGALTRAARESWTMAGVCQAGDYLGIIDGDIAVIGSDLTRTAVTVVERMLAGGGELITLIGGADTPADVAEGIEARARALRPEVDVTVYDGGQELYPLLIGVE